MFLALLLTIVGFIIGLGAVTVIDLHGFFGRHSSYWTEATIRTHKITKPLIWLGMFFVLLGHIVLAREGFFSEGEFMSRMLILGALILNGCFLSFVVSPELLKREQESLAKDLLPKKLQHKIMASFFVSFVGWWGLVVLLVKSLVEKF